MVKSFRNPLDTSFFAAKSDVPKPATTMPPSVSDMGAVGGVMSKFALEDHTHASKARKARMQCAADGSLTWTYMAADGVTPAPFGSGVVPRVIAVAEAATGVTDVINVQLVDTPGNVSCKVLVNRTNRSTVALIGLTILSVPTQPGITWVHLVALEP